MSASLVVIIQDRQDLNHQVAPVVVVIVAVVLEALHTATSRDIHPVPVLAPKLERALLELAVLLDIARRFVMHILLQQAAQLIIITTSEVLPHNK